MQVPVNSTLVTQKVEQGLASRKSDFTQIHIIPAGC